jgi:hypothetical protein
MAVTAIKGFKNYTEATVTVTNAERNDDRTVGGNGGTLAFDIWIPWCTSQSDFNWNHYMTIDIPVPRYKYWIWQHDVGGDDRVRQSQNGWQYAAPPVSGISSTGGDRYVIIYGNGLVEFEEIED